MKILQINSVCGVGSTGRIATDLYHILKQQGHECKIAYGRGEAKNIPLEDTIKIGTDFDVNFHALMTRITDKTGFYSKKATKKLLKKIYNFKPDIIHLHNLHGYYLNIEVLFNYLKATNIPVVWTLHDCWAFTGHCAHFTYVGCDKWKTQCKHCPQKRIYPSSFIIDNSNKNFIKKKNLFSNMNNLTIITVSDWLKQMVEQSFFRNYKIKNIYNGVDLSVFNKQKSDIKNHLGIVDKKMVLCVSNGWNERKGLDDIINISKVTSEDTVFVIVGLSLKQISKLPNNIIGMERTWDVNELIKLYSAADVFLNPSKEETFGLVTAEALACGTPVIVYNSTACPELVDKDSGYVVNNIKEMVEILNVQLKNPLKINDSIIRFDKNICYNSYINVYKQLLKQE